MKITDKLVQSLLSDISNKTILEVACGRADFSLSASEYAKDVFCIDIVDSRLNPNINKENIHFEIMDAASMSYPSEIFDSVFIFNAFAHIEQQWESIKSECMRVLKKNGKMYIIGSWKIDISLMEAIFFDNVKRIGEFAVVELNKDQNNAKADGK